MANKEQLAILDQGVDTWNNWRKENPDVSIDLSGANLKKKNLAGINFAHAELNEVNLSFADLSHANLAFAEFENAILSFGKLDGANLSAAKLENAYIEDANLNNTNITGANLKNAKLTNTNLKNAYLIDAQFEGAYLNAVNLESANVSSVNFDCKIMKNVIRETLFRPKDLWSRRYDILLDTTIRCKGVNAATSYGSQRFKLFLQDQDFLEEYLDTKWGKRIYFIWWLFADCGRSLGRWAGWSVVFAFLFAIIYWLLGSGAFETEHLNFSFLTLLYYSVVTFTTLGFGDIIPKTSTAALWVMLEVIFGYIMLGGLITIFASKLSRRGG